jgi:hypothetical protein
VIEPSRDAPSGVDEAKLDDPPLAAEPSGHDVHAPADLGKVARLPYSMVRNVMASQELPRAAGTVTKKLGSWLHEQG